MIWYLHVLWKYHDKFNNHLSGKTRVFFKKIRDAKGIFHAEMGTINDRNGMDLTEEDNIKKRWQGLPWWSSG